MNGKVNRNELEDYLPHEFFLDDVDITISTQVYEDFKRALASARNERPLQAFLERHPEIMGSLMGGHLGRWVVPQKRLGSEHVTDFVIGDCSSSGLHWIAVELESPVARMFNKNGDPSSKLTHAIRQIQDWRSWLSDNRAYAQRKTARGGLGLFGIRARVPATIFIGRSSTLLEDNQNRRAQMSEELGIELCTYDRLLRHCAYLANDFDEISI